MDSCLAELERRPDDRELVSEMFRTVHTIKGTTGFLGYARLEALAHAGEGLLGALRDGKIRANSTLVDTLLELMDRVRVILQLIQTTGGEGVRSSDDDSDLIARLQELRTLGISWDSPPACVPVLAEAAPKSIDPLVFVPSLAPVPPAAATPEVDSRRSPDQAGAEPPTSAGEQTLRIDAEVLNRMMNLVGELVLTRNQIVRSAPGAENFPELARRLDSVTAQLRESVMQARMQPVGNLFGKFPRLVRDLARSCGKRVRIEFDGQETGLDKSLLEAIKDPLTHSLRNSIDHGIETPEVRVRVGKPVEGLVSLRAFHKNGFVVIELRDDGAGISLERVLAKAVESRLITPERAASMSEREALQLIFAAGLSTAREVSHISGRGVGMDVVRANVERVGGTVEVESQPGVGTTLRLRIPLTLAIMPALVVRSGGQSFALPQNALLELVYVPRNEVEQAVERIGTAEVYRLRGRLLPLVWLDRLLELDECPQAHGIYIAVLDVEGCRFGLVVDDLLPPEEIVVKPLSAALREIGLFSGATVLGTGLLSMILDVSAVAARAGVQPLSETPAGQVGEREESPQPAIAGAGSMVIYELEKEIPGGRRAERMAMPLSLVERIESVLVHEIEYAGGRPVLHHRGILLPLEDEGGMLLELGAAETATVLICNRSALGTGGTSGASPQKIGVVVRRILDVSAGTLMAMNGGAAGQTLAMVDGRLASLHREFVPVAQQPALAWKEIA